MLKVRPSLDGKAQGFCGVGRSNYFGLTGGKSSPPECGAMSSEERCPKRSAFALLCMVSISSLAVRGYLSCSTGKLLLTPLDPRASATNRPRTGIETSIAMAAASKVTTAVAIERASAPCNIGNPSMTE